MAKSATKEKRSARATAGKSLARRKVKAARQAKPKSNGPRKQTFVANHLSADAFEQGLRSYAKYRDLGISKATNGMVQAHVIKMVPPCLPEVVSKRHYHDVQFQMIYVLKGWMKGAYEGAAITCARAPAGYSRRRSSIPCWTIRTIASFWKSSCRPTSILSSYDSLIAACA